MSWPTPTHEPPAWMGDIRIATKWDTWTAEQLEAQDADGICEADRHVAVWLALSQQIPAGKLRCDECMQPRSIDALAAVALCGSPEDPRIGQVHCICTDCAGHYHRALSLAHAWLADRIEAAATRARDTDHE
jgi:hypothetical protein